MVTDAAKVCDYINCKYRSMPLLINHFVFFNKSISTSSCFCSTKKWKQFSVVVLTLCLLLVTDILSLQCWKQNQFTKSFRDFFINCNYLLQSVSSKQRSFFCENNEELFSCINYFVQNVPDSLL